MIQLLIENGHALSRSIFIIHYSLIAESLISELML